MNEIESQNAPEIKNEPDVSHLELTDEGILNLKNEAIVSAQNKEQQIEALGGLNKVEAVLENPSAKQKALDALEQKYNDRVEKLKKDRRTSNSQEQTAVADFLRDMLDLSTWAKRNWINLTK